LRLHKAQRHERARSEWVPPVERQRTDESQEEYGVGLTEENAYKRDGAYEQ